jgi:hypothetical protein
MAALAAPGVRHAYHRGPDDRHTATMTHPDGSWAWATAIGLEPPTVRQGAPRRLWDIPPPVRHLHRVEIGTHRDRLEGEGEVTNSYG